MGGVGRGRGRGNRTVLLPQAPGSACLPPTPVPSDKVFQGVFERQAMQAQRAREEQIAAEAAGTSWAQVGMTTPFGRGAIPSMGPVRGQAMPMSAGLQPGGLQQMQMTTPRDRPILDMPRELAPPPQPQNPNASRLVYEPDGQIVYYGADASHVFHQTYQTNWSRTWHATNRQQ